MLLDLRDNDTLYKTKNQNKLNVLIDNSRNKAIKIIEKQGKYILVLNNVISIYDKMSKETINYFERN